MNKAPDVSDTSDALGHYLSRDLTPYMSPPAACLNYHAVHRVALLEPYSGGALKRVRFTPVVNWCYGGRTKTKPVPSLLSLTYSPHV